MSAPPTQPAGGTGPRNPVISDEICRVCGRDAGGSAFCHFYEAGRRVSLCSPACAERYLHAGTQGADEPPAWSFDLLSPPG